MPSHLERISIRPSPIQWIGIGAGALAFFGVLVFGGEKLVILLNGMVLAAGLLVVSYRFPAVMVLLWGLSTQIMAEAIIWDYSKYIEPSLNIGGGIDMLYGDPVLFGMLGAMTLKLFTSDDRARSTYFSELSLWSVFMLWMIFELVRSITMFGLVSPLGEFRTYFREILVVPYIAIFARTREQQWRMFKVLMWITLIMIPIGLFRGAYVHKFRFAAYAKWLYQHGSLGLVWGTVGLYLMHRFGFWRHGNIRFALLIAVSMGLTVIASHRSVWLASMVAMVVLFLMGHLRLGNMIKMGMVLLAAALIINFAYSEIDLVAFIEKRLVALTNPTKDQTANWRYLIWLDAIEQSKSHWLEGKGLGNYFMMRAPNGLIVTKMLHNQYIQLLYQVGLVGLLLYLAFVLQVFLRMRRVYRETFDPFYKMISLLGIVVLLGASAYYVAYDFEPFTWLFVGLGIAVSLSHREQAEQDAMYYYAQASPYMEDAPYAGDPAGAS